MIWSKLERINEPFIEINMNDFTAEVATHALGNHTNDHLY